jgi:hypothetical protein
MPKLTPEELLRAIEQEPVHDDDADDDAHEDAGAADRAFDAAVAEVLAMSPEERRRDLEKHGVDVEALHAETAAFLGRPASAAPSAGHASPVSASAPAPAPAVAPAPPPTPPAQAPISLASRRKKPPTLLLVAAALALCAAAAASIYFRSPEPPPTPPPPPKVEPPPRSPGPDIAELRQEGLAACKAQSWRVCWDKLEAADRADPAGAHAQVVEYAKGQAALALAGGADAGTQNAKSPPPEMAPRPEGSGPR